MDPAFPAFLEGFKLESLESSSSVIYATDSELRLIYFNPSWFAFARDNGGEPAISTRFPLFTPLMDAILGPLKQFYLAAFLRVLEKGSPWEHEYECSSETYYRRFHQTIYPLRNRKGLVFVNSLLVDALHKNENKNESPPLPEVYTAPETGNMNMCSHCRRIQRVKETEVWDWIPEFIANPLPNTSHTLCPICYDYYFKSKFEE